MRRPTGPFRRADETFHESAGTKKHSMYTLPPAKEVARRAVTGVKKVVKGAVNAVDKVMTGVENRMKKTDDSRRLRNVKLVEKQGFPSFDSYSKHMAGMKKKR